MSSPTAQRPAGPMAATARTGTSRLPGLSMANGGNDKTSQPIAPFPSSWQPAAPGPNSIWGSASIAHFNRAKDTTTSKGAPSRQAPPPSSHGLTYLADTSDAFPHAPSGSGALAATSEAEPWGSRSGPWNNSTDATQTRNVSGNTSPSRSRVEPSMHERANSQYFSPGPPQVQPAIGQRANVRSKATAATDPTTSAYNHLSGFSDFIDTDKEPTSGFGAFKYNNEQGYSAYGASQRQTQDTPFSSMAGGSSRDPGMPTSSHSDLDRHTQTFGDLAFSAHTANSTNSHRPSMSLSHNSRSYSQGIGQQLDQNDIHGKFAGLSLGDGLNGASNGMSYGAGPQQTAFNPQSQPWGPTSQGYQAEFPKETFQPAPSFEKRGSIADRGSPAGSSYRAGLNSPKSYNGTPQPAADTWSLPASQNLLRVSPEAERRSQGAPYGAQQQAYSHNFYSNPTYQQFGQYPQHMYEHAYYRAPPVPLAPAFGMPISSYGHNAGANGMSMPRPSKDQDIGRGYRSALLDQFRSNSKSNKRQELKDLYAHIVEFSGDQHGSRFIQEKLETANSDEKDQVFRELEPNSVQLMKDVFGNYVIQKFFEHGNQVQKKVLANAMKGKVVDLSLQMYGCRVVQKALEHILVDQQAELVKELEVDVQKVVKDQNGNHVIQKVIELVPRQHIGFIMDCFKGRVSELSSHAYGCRVIQRVLEHGNEADRADIMKELHKSAHHLVADQYGNYVAQHVIQHGLPEDRAKMISVVTDQLMSLSKHKFASNVVEKCIEYGSPAELRRIREQLSAPGDEINSPLPLIMKDQYGNYVVQKLLTRLKSQPQEWDLFADVVRSHFPALKKANTGRQNTAAIDRLAAAVATPPTTRNGTPPSTAPTSPTLPVDISSGIPTPPILTMGPNSPSSSPPSTNDGIIGDAVERAGAKLSSSSTKSSPHTGVSI